MTWFKIDDTFAFHQKVVQAGDAIAMWARAGSWCSQHLTDGFVPDHMVAMLGRPIHARTLVQVGLWDRDEDRHGFSFHDFAEYNPSRVDVEENRARERRKKRLQRTRGAGAAGRDTTTGRYLSPGLSPGDTPGDSHQASPATRPDPTRPVPISHLGLVSPESRLQNKSNVGNARDRQPTHHPTPRDPLELD